MTNPLNPAFRRPNTIPHGAAHDSVRSAIQSHDNSITDLNQAVASLKTQINDLTPSSSSSSGTATNTATSTESITNVTTISGGVVNDQTGVTAYTTANSDNGALLLLGDTDPVAVSLNQSVALPFYFFVLNQGAGLVTLTPQLGEIDGGATQILAEGFGATIFFDGFNFFSVSFPIVPATFDAIAHEFLVSYDATTGIFSASTVGFSDLTGIAATDQIGTGTPSAGKYVDGGTGAWTALPTVPATKAPVAGEYLTGYNAATGAFSVSATPGISVTITTAALTGGGTQGSMTFSNGLLVNSVQST